MIFELNRGLPNHSCESTRRGVNSFCRSHPIAGVGRNLNKPLTIMVGVLYYGDSLPNALNSQ